MAKEEKKKEEKKKMKIDPLSDTVDLNAINFKNKDVMKWTKPKKSSNSTKTPALVGMGTLGGRSGSSFRKPKKKK